MEIQKKLREEEKRLLKESAYKRKLKRQREKYKSMKNANGAEYQSFIEKQRMYYNKKYEKYKLKIAKDREERVIAFLGERNFRKINVEGKGSYYVVDDGHVYKKTGKEIGSVDSNGYVVASTLGFMHRLIWETFKGKIPEGYEIDHINTIRNDNRLENLRLVSHKENCNNPLSIHHYKQSNKGKGINKKQYIGDFYDSSLSDKENVEKMKEFGLKLSTKTLQRWRKENNITKYKAKHKSK